MAHIDPERMRFEEFLPFQINGSLGSDDAAFMQQYLANHPQMHNEVSFVEALRSAIKETGETRAADAGLSRLLNEFRSLHKRPSFIERIRLECLNWGLTPAFAIAATVILIQSIMLTQYQLPSPEVQYRGLSSQRQAMPNLKITINPKSNYAELVDILRQTGCRVVSGPSETGELWVAFDEPQKTEQIRRTLLDSGLVDDAIVTSAKETK